MEPRSTDTQILRTPRYHGHPDITDTQILRTPRYYGHPDITDTQILRTPRYYGHPDIADTQILRTPRYYGHPDITDTQILRTPRYYGHPDITDTQILRTPRYYGQFRLPRRKVHISYLTLSRLKRTPVNTNKGRFSAFQVTNSHTSPTLLYGHWLPMHCLFLCHTYVLIMTYS